MENKEYHKLLEESLVAVSGELAVARISIQEIKKLLTLPDISIWTDLHNKLCDAGIIIDQVRDRAIELAKG